MLAVLPSVAAQLLQGDTERRTFIATVLGVFGNLINQFPLGIRRLNLELGIAAYNASLEVFTREAMPVDWAGVQMNLANAYRNRIQGDRAQNIENAIAACKASLEGRTREHLPAEWAQSMNSLANAYSDLIRGDRAGNLEQAITAYNAVLEIFKPDLLPNDCRRTARSLGNLYCEQTRWQSAVSAYQTALQAAETLYQSANLLDSQAAELSETADLPRRAAYALARVGDLQKAVETLEQGRARGLSESLNRDRTDLAQLQQTHPDLCQNYQEIANQLRNLEAQQRDRMTSEERHSLTPEELRDIFALNLAEQGGLRLAILSACETGMIGTKNADEVISLPTGLLQAGVAAVIASLWGVSDLSTMLLLRKFYELWRTNNQEPSVALRQAQRWLRDRTEAEIAPLLDRRTRNPAHRPFSHPYHWAAFSYTGV